MSKKNNSKYYYNRNQYKSNKNIKSKKYNNKNHSNKKTAKKITKGHNPSGNSISADLSQFQGTSFVEASKLCRKFIPNENEFHALKHGAKNAIAQRVRFSVRKLNLLKPISKNSKNMLCRYLNDNGQNNIVSNVNCIINAYNMFDRYELKTPKYVGTDKDKVLQHLDKDFYKALDTYIVSAKKHAESKLSHYPEVKSLLQKYQILLDSLHFFYDFICKSITENIPEKITSDCVADASMAYNINLCKYYAYDSDNDQYVAKSKIPLSIIEEDYTTYIICFCR